MPTIKKLVGDLAQTSVGVAVSTTATITSGSANIAVASAAGLNVGQTIAGAGIPAGTTILSVAGTTVTLSAAATVTGAAVPVTQTEQQVLGLRKWTIDGKLKTPDATTTDDAAWESSLPSSKSWSAKADYMFYDGDASQQANLLNWVSASVPSRWNFFPDAVSSDFAYTGLAYVDSFSMTAGAGEMIAINVSLKGTGPLLQVAQTAPIVNASTISGLQAEI